MSEMEADNSRALKRWEEKYEMTNAFNILSRKWTVWESRSRETKVLSLVMTEIRETDRRDTFLDVEKTALMEVKKS